MVGILLGPGHSSRGAEVMICGSSAPTLQMGTQWPYLTRTSWGLTPVSFLALQAARGSVGMAVCTGRTGTTR